ncbi:MAG: glycerophosphodiester phosphodiesterase [Planctomycetota bacterium]|jgi:glycerophosphoryl diester phosphodiesterase
MIWTGHRGASLDAPENTLASIRLAFEQGADAVEIDVRLTRDNTVVAFHDEDTSRIAGGGEKVSDLTLEEVKRLDAGAWKGKEWKGERVPTLEEAIAVLPEGKILFIEIKSGREILDPLSTVLEEDSMKDRCVLIGFDRDTMQAAKQRFPGFDVGWIHSLEEDRKKCPDPASLLVTAQNSGFACVSLRACELVDRVLVEQAHKLGLKVYVWTVNDPDEARHYLRMGVDGITTDRPAYRDR